MTNLEMIINEIGQDEWNRVERWLNYSNERFSRAGLDSREMTRQSLFILNKQAIKPKTLFVITNIVLGNDWFFPLPEKPLFRNISKLLQQKYSVELHYLDGIVYFIHTDNPWNFEREFRKACGLED